MLLTHFNLFSSGTLSPRALVSVLCVTSLQTPSSGTISSFSCTLWVRTRSLSSLTWSWESACLSELAWAAGKFPSLHSLFIPNNWTQNSSFLRLLLVFLDLASWCLLWCSTTWWCCWLPWCLVAYNVAQITITLSNEFSYSDSFRDRELPPRTIWTQWGRLLLLTCHPVVAWKRSQQWSSQGGEVIQVGR